jgi:hypothetical protein
LDGYFYNYPLAYKHQFRRLIAGELEKSPLLASYYDNFGSRFYIFSSEVTNARLGAADLLTKERVNRYDFHIENLSFDTPVFKEMGGKYLFSAVKVGNSAEIGLRLVRTFARQDSPWQIYLYEAI